MGHRIISRAEWDARYGSSGIKRRVGGLEKWLHHSVTVAPDLVAPFTDDYAAIRTIERIGHQRFGRYGFPYTFAFTPAGLIFAGHPIDEVGAHTQGHNTAGAGFVLVGNYEHDRPTGAQIEAVAWTLQEGVRRGWWRYAELDGGHRDTKATACPGRYAYAAIDDINRLAAGAPIDTTGPGDRTDAASRDDDRKPLDTDGLEVDGKWGSGTIRRRQQLLKKAGLYDGQIDGLLSHQNPAWRRDNPGCTTGWDWDTGYRGAGGSATIHADQKRLARIKDAKGRPLYRGVVDGLAGPKYFKALQREQGTTVDGEIWKPSACVRGMQRDMNAGRLG